MMIYSLSKGNSSPEFSPLEINSFLLFGYLDVLDFNSTIFSSPPLQIYVTFNPAGSYAVDGLKPDTLYFFSLAARSEMGLGVYTQPIQARTAQSSKSFLVCLSPVFLSAQRTLTSKCVT